MKKSLFLSAIILAAFMTGCSDNTPVIDSQSKNSDPLKENMINANKYFASSEETEIDSYISRRQWQMEKLNNGTRLSEYVRGNGKALENEEVVKVLFKVETLTGTTIYEQVDDEVVMGRGQAIPGLESALKRLSHGSKARVIVPSAMAYGVVGDGDRITTRMVIVLDLEVL